MTKIRVILAMTLLTGAFALMVGNAYQAQMPNSPATSATAIPACSTACCSGADATGAFLAGIVLEGSRLLQPRARTAFL